MTNYRVVLIIFLLSLVASIAGNVTHRGVTRHCIILQPTFVNCSHLNLKRIPMTLPRKTARLDLSYSNITIIGNQLIYLPNLRYLYLGHNQVSVISPDAFSRNRWLHTLDLSSNRLTDTSIGNDTFKHIKNLQNLYLHNNKYRQYPVQQFSYLTGLRNLSLDVRKNSVFGDEFSNLVNLTYLKLVSQQRFRIQKDTFANFSSLAIESLVLIFVNHIQRIVHPDYLHPFKHLRYARIQFGGYYTSIKDVLQSLQGLSGQKLDFLDLSHNYMFTGITQELTDKDLKPLSNICVKKIDLTKNAIIKFISFVLWNSTFSSCVKEVNIAGNKFIMNDYLFILYMANMQVIEKINVANIPLYGTEDDIKATPPHYFYSPDGLESKFKRRFKITLFASKSLRSLNLHGIPGEFRFAPTKLNFVVPNLKDIKLGSMGLDFCSFTEPVQILAESAQLLDMSGWNCADLNPEFLSRMKHFKSIRILKAKNSKMGEGLSRDKYAKFVKGFKHLQMIDLSENQLSTLHDELFHDQKDSLRHVILDKNSLESIPRTTLALNKVRHIHLHHNRLDSLSADEMHILASRNISLGLGGNIFQCGCNNLPSLRWIEKNSHNVFGLHAIECRHQEEMLHEIISNLNEFEIHCLAEKWLPISVAVSVIIITSILSSALGYRYRYTLMFHYLRATRYSKSGQSQRFENDVFISYSYVQTELTPDSTWLFNTLHPYLENILKLKVVFDEKDFPLGEGLVNNIYDYMMKSRKIILIMSRAFLHFKDAQCHMEMAKMHSFHRGRSSLIVIFFDDMPKQELPESLATIWFKIDFLYWPNDDSEEEKRRLFWQQLKALLAE